MGLFFVISSVACFAIFVHALTPTEAWHPNTPSVGESCVFEGYSGVVTTTDNCPGAASIWQYGPRAEVQCCITAPCNTRGDAIYSGYTCLNTYKKEQCDQGQGKFIPGHCLGDKTVQCCVPAGGETPGYHDQNLIYDWHDPSDDGSVVVPTLPTSDENSITVPTIPSVRSTDETNTDNVNDDGSITVPTFITPPTPSLPIRPGRGREGSDWHKEGWGEDIATADEGYGVDDDMGSDSGRLGGYDGALSPFFLDA